MLLVAIVVAAFCPLLAGDQELLSWDDTTNLVDNDGFKGLDTAHLVWMWTHVHLAVYEPIAWLLKAVEYQAFGLSARGFHIVTLALHVGSALAVLGIARSLLGRALPTMKRRELEGAATLSALVFAIHPLRVEVVAWASGQSYALAGFLALCSLAAYVRFVETERKALLAVATVAYIAAGLSKSAVAMLPLALFVVDAYPLRRALSRRLVLEKLPMLLAMIGLVILAGTANRDGSAGNTVTLDLGERIGRAAQALVHYVAETAWPAALAPVYPIEPERLSPFAAPSLLAIGALLMLTMLSVRVVKEAPWLAASLGSALVLILPVLGLVQHGALTLGHDRYTYLPTVGPALVLGVILWRARERVPRVVAAGVVLFAGLTAVRTRAWRTTESLWRETLLVAPGSSLALNNLGWHLITQERFAEAEPLLARAVAVEPRDATVALNYGVTLEKLGRADEALGFYARALRTLPDEPRILFNAATILSRTGRVEEARAGYERAAKAKPDWPLPRERLARLPAPVEAP